MKLENDYLRIDVNPIGAELTSVQSTNDKEFIWQADSEIWPRHAPNLFPIVGRLKEDSFVYEDQTYSLGQHGFARDMEFDVVKWNPSELVFSLKSSLKTYPGYPFDFDFRIGYSLDGNVVKQSFTVVNTNDEVLPFSFGGHPAFAVKRIEDSYLEFDQAEDVQSDTVKGGIRTGEMRQSFEGNKIYLSQRIFEKDALLFSGLRSKSVVLKSLANKPMVKLGFEGFPYLGIWSKPGANYVCIEPWCGIADKLEHSKKIEEKEGINLIQPGEQFSRAFSMEFYTETEG